MKKLFSKVVAFAFILCASIALFACGTDKDTTQDDKKPITEITNQEVFANAYNYMVEHDHIVSAEMTEYSIEDGTSTETQTLKYKYNSGNYIAQTNYDGAFVEIDKTTVKQYFNNKSERYERVTIHNIQTDEVNTYKQTALIGVGGFDFIEILESKAWTFNKNGDIYTGVYTDSGATITVKFDDVKLLSVKTEDSDEGGSYTTTLTLGYTTVEMTNYDFASKVDVEAYKTTLASQIANLKSTTWTATTDTSKTVSHTANETTVTFNGQSKTFDEVIPAFNSNSVYYSAYKYTDGTVKLSWGNDDDTYTYTLEGNVLKSVKVNEYHGNDYTINF